MKKTLTATILLAASSSAMAVAPGGSGCGWGSLLFDGQAGMGPHVVAATTNASTGNNTFGMTSGTNGCSVDGSLDYGGESMISSIMDEFSEDVARGQGEALDAVAVVIGIEKADRDSFAKLTHENFNVIFPSENVTAKDVLTSLNSLMKADSRLAKYAS